MMGVLTTSHPMADHSRIVLLPEVLSGKPVIRGTRISVEFVVGLMADGWTADDILGEYPGLTQDDLLACLAYARDILKSEKAFPSAAEQLRRLRTLRGRLPADVKFDRERANSR